MARNDPNDHAQCCAAVLYLSAMEDMAAGPPEQLLPTCASLTSCLLFPLYNFVQASCTRVDPVFADK